MADPVTPPHSTANEFDAVKTFVEALKGLGPEIQERALRYASEALGLRPPASSQGPAGQVVTPQGHAHGATTETPRHMPKDIRTFTNAKAPKTDQQFAAVVAYYYRFEAPDAQRKEMIDAKDLAEAARLVDRKRPGNAHFTLQNAKNSGYLDSVGGGKFRINTVGENLVAMTLPGAGKDGGSPEPKIMRRSRATKNLARTPPRKRTKKKH